MNNSNNSMINDTLTRMFIQEMIRSNKSTKWWSSNLQQEITNLFSSELNSGSQKAVLDGARAYLNSGSLPVNQYFYNTKELSDKKEIFAVATLFEKSQLYRLISSADKIAVINNNKDLELKDIYEILVSKEFDYASKKAIANNLDIGKIKKLKENYVDLDKLLREWLGRRYETIFPPKELRVIKEEKKIPRDFNVTKNKENISNNNMRASKVAVNDDLMKKYNQATNKVLFFYGLADIQKQRQLFNKLSTIDKREILNSKIMKGKMQSSFFLINVYNSSENKNELLDLMNLDTLATLYKMSSLDRDKKLISDNLNKRRNNIERSVKNNVNNIAQENASKSQYRDNITHAKKNINKLNSDVMISSMSINSSRVVIKAYEKRKDMLKKKLNDTVFKKSSRVTFISKLREKKIQKITEEINRIDAQIEERRQNIDVHEQSLNNINDQIQQERKKIIDNEAALALADRRIKSYAQRMYGSDVYLKEVTSFHKELISGKTFNQSISPILTTVPRSKTQAIANKYSNRKKKKNSNLQSRDIQRRANSNLKNNQQDNKEVDNTSKKNAQNMKANTNGNKKANFSQRQGVLEKQFAKMGISFHPEVYVAKKQNYSYVSSEKIASMNHKDAKKMKLYSEAQFAKKMSDIVKKQQQQAIKGRSRTLSKSGFSNILILSLSLMVLILLGMLISVVLK